MKHHSISFIGGGNMAGSLIGGLIVQVGSHMIDSSIKTKLQKLQSAMKGA